MSIKSIAIEITNKAFLPEAYAYRDYFESHGFFCEFINQGSNEILDYDAVVLFHGFHPFWKKYPKFIIGEYNSLSTGKYSRVKDLIKRIINVKSDFYIFLNEDVRQKMWLKNKKRYLIRGMGYSQHDFIEYRFEEKFFDIVYCGSYRKGLLTYIQKLADLDFKIALVGFETSFKHKNVSVLGRMSPKQARRVISQACFGLNYTPDIFPLNIQDSTKVIEYCAAGLGVITNKYKWIDDFERLREARFLDLDIIKTREDISNFNFLIPDVSDLDWNYMLENSHINKVLL